ncbi:purine-binding chemotaxis protein CheW [Curvibacter sp. CHRR-16]|uniref:chemotaxis protein CheW n=1 Tax=Curvibacter sp. CHRR-16 TaxID=2835872 RepID=UPI001BD91798|nr:chemotaxis protein CheW [Curvibacter sp. CHRR-16]MBT0571450.1 purine-binding chemotaxis protein CheW [Curvibacter sp. CHRR-16]
MDYAKLLLQGQPDTILQCLTYWVDDELFAMNINRVREIIQHASMTVVPLMPSFVRGVINLRGSVVPVIDLRARLGRSPTPLGKKTSIIILDVSREGERLDLGVMVDAVSEVIEVRQSQIESPPNFGTSIDRDYLQGVAKVAGQFVGILDTERALSMDEMAQLVATQ